MPVFPGFLEIIRVVIYKYAHKNNKISFINVSYYYISHKHTILLICKNKRLILSAIQNTYTLKRQIVHIEEVGCSGKHITDIIVT